MTATFLITSAFFVKASPSPSDIRIGKRIPQKRTPGSRIISRNKSSNKLPELVKSEPSIHLSSFLLSETKRSSSVFLSVFQLGFRCNSSYKQLVPRVPFFKNYSIIHYNNIIAEIFGLLHIMSCQDH